MQGHNTPTKPRAWACSQLRVFWSTLDGSRASEAPGTSLAHRGRFPTVGPALELGVSLQAGVSLQC